MAPESVGVNPARLRLLLDRVRSDVEDGPLPSAQVAVAKDGHLVAFETYGDARPDTRYILHSGSRPVVAAAVWLLLSRGQLAVDERIADIIPEFAANGKEGVTVFQVLTQTAGFPLAPMRPEASTDRDLRLATFAKWRLTYEPGTQFEFHLTSAAWVLAEIIERRTGLPIAEYIRTEISEPLGLSIELGVPVDRQADTVAPMLPKRDLAGEIDDSPYSPWLMRDPEVVAAGNPSHTVVATASDMARLFQAFFHSGRWDPAVVAEATRLQVEMDISGNFGTSGVHAGRTGYFVMVEGPASASKATFGHNGAPSSHSWCDPEVGLSFSFLHNGHGANGYDRTRSGASRSVVISGMAGDVVV